MMKNLFNSQYPIWSRYSLNLPGEENFEQIRGVLKAYPFVIKEIRGKEFENNFYSKFFYQIPKSVNKYF